MQTKELVVLIAKSPWTWLKWACRTALNVLRALLTGQVCDESPKQPFGKEPKIEGVGNYEIYKDVRARVAEEADYRRDRQWTLATWVIGLFTATIAGLIALMSQGKELTASIQWGLTGWVVFVAVCACVRILHDSVVGDFHSKAAFQMDEHFKLAFDDSKHKIDMKQSHLLMTFIVVLGAGTIVLVWNEGLIKSAPETPKACECRHCVQKEKPVENPEGTHNGNTSK